MRFLFYGWIFVSKMIENVNEKRLMSRQIRFLEEDYGLLCSRSLRGDDPVSRVINRANDRWKDKIIVMSTPDINS